MQMFKKVNMKKRYRLTAMTKRKGRERNQLGRTLCGLALFSCGVLLHLHHRVLRYVPVVEDPPPNESHLLPSLNLGNKNAAENLWGTAVSLHAAAVSHSPPEGSQPDTCIITTAAWNKCGFVWTLYDTIKVSNPKINCFVWYVSDINLPFDEKASNKVQQILSEAPFEIVTMDQLTEFTISSTKQAAFIFDEASFALMLRPFALKYTFHVLGASSAIYLDPDIWVGDSLSEVQEYLDTKSVVTTLHTTKPLPEYGISLSDAVFVKAGVFNLGFLGFSRTTPALAFLDVWCEAAFKCIEIQEGAVHFGDTWGNLLLSYFSENDYYAFRDSRYNVAPWNLHYNSANLVLKDGRPYFIDDWSAKKGRPVVFFHFSGVSVLDSNDNDAIDQYLTRYTTLGYFPILREIVYTYLTLLGRHGAHDYRAIPYGTLLFGDSGIEVEQWMRLRYADMVYNKQAQDLRPSKFLPDAESPYNIESWSRVSKALFRQQVHLDPFCPSLDKCQGEPGTAKLTYLEWLMSGPHHMSVNMEGRFYYSDIMHRVWQGRTDLQKAFQDPTGRSYAAFSNWFETYALRENMVSKGIYERWRATRDYHISHHWEFHRQVSSISDVGVNVFGWHLASFGIALAAVNLVNAIRSVDGRVVPVHFPELPHVSTYFRLESLDYSLSRSYPEAVNLFVANPNLAESARREMPFIWDSKYNIAWWFWEVEKLPDDMLNALADYDEIWLPSQFVLDAVRQTPGYDGTPLRVLPIPTAMQKEMILLSPIAVARDPQEAALDDIPDDAFVFLVVFDFYSVVQRKNPEAAVRAFVNAFPQDQDKQHKYRLVVKTSHGSVEGIQALRDLAGNDPRVQVLTEILTHAEMNNLQQRADCYVSLHRSEGYGLNILQAMVKGVPVIATNYSGNVEFFRAVTQFLGTCHFAVPYKIVQLEESYGPYGEGNHWADPDHEFAVKAMRTVVQNDCKVRHGQRMTEAVYAQFGMEAVGRKVQEHLAQSFPLIQAKQTKGS